MKNVALDIGTNSIKAFVSGKGIVFSQANAVSFDSLTGEIIAVGDSAGKMIEKAPDTIIVKTPVRGGVIFDFDSANTILSYVINKFSSGELLKPDFIITVPGTCTEVQKKTIIDIACMAGAARVSLVEAPIASAYGCAVDVDRPFGTLVVDIGAGTTDIAVITMGTIASSSTLMIGGNDIDDAIVQFIRFEKKIQISHATAEKLKRTIGCAVPGNESVEMSFGGKDVVSSLPVTGSISNRELAVSVNPLLQKIMNEIRSAMEMIPAQMYSDICSSGIILSGGSSRLKNIDRLFESFFNIPVKVCKDAENTAVKGAGYLLDRIASFEDSGYLFKIRHQSRFSS